MNQVKFLVLCCLCLFSNAQIFNIDLYGNYNYLIATNDINHYEKPSNFPDKAFSNYFKDAYSFTVGVKLFIALTDSTELKRDLIFGINHASHLYSFRKSTSSQYFGEKLDIIDIFPFVGYGQKYNNSYIYALVGISYKKFLGVNLNESVQLGRETVRTDIHLEYSQEKNIKVIIGSDYNILEFPISLGYGIEFDFGETSLESKYERSTFRRTRFEKINVLRYDKLALFIKASYELDFSNGL